ncbi:MAG: hypothetical protein WCL32_07270 [Planctomycetota bacterium]
MYLSQAVDEIRDTLVQHRLSGRKALWSTILKQIAKQNSFDGHYADTILDAIRAFLKPLDDKTIISLWRETETGMCDETEDECLFPECCRIDLEMEILHQTTELAWWEAEQLKPKSKRKKRRPEMEDD